jgi:hypothetical protein
MEGVWNIPCYVCGHLLGSNKEECGKSGAKKHPRPPCVWAASDNTIVLLCQRKDAAKKMLRKANEEKEEAYKQQQSQYEAGTLRETGHTFTYGRRNANSNSKREVLHGKRAKRSREHKSTRQVKKNWPKCKRLKFSDILKRKKTGG